MRVVPLVLGSFLLAGQACFAQISERKDYTQDCSKATQPIPMRFTQASSPNVHIWYVEGSTAKNLAGATTVLYYYTPATRTWSVTVTGSVVSASGGHINVAFLPSQLNTNSLTGDFDYLCKVSDGANQVLAVTKGALTLDEDISATAGIGGLPAVTNSLNWGLYSNYVNTGSAGAYRQGSNITFRSNADGSVMIDSLESTSSYAIVSASVLSLSNLTATINTNVNILLTNTVPPSGTNTLRTDLNVLTTNSVSPSGTNTLRTDLNVLTTNSVSPSGTNLLRIDVDILLTNSVPPSGTNTLQAQISSNDTDIADHETRMTTLEEANSASTNTFRSITIGDTNYLAGELTTNGQFTTDSGHWTLSTSYWANSRIHINAGLTGTMTPSNALAITNGATYLVSYLKGTTNGQVTVSFSGLTNAATSGGVHYWLAPCVAQTNTFRFTMTGGGSGNYIDDIRVRKITNGLAAVSDDLLVGGDLMTIGNLTVGGTLAVTNSISSATNIFTYWDDPLNAANAAYLSNGETVVYAYDIDVPVLYADSVWSPLYNATNLWGAFLRKDAPDTNVAGLYGKFVALSNVVGNNRWYSGDGGNEGLVVNSDGQATNYSASGRVLTVTTDGTRPASLGTPALASVFGGSANPSLHAIASGGSGFASDLIRGEVYTAGATNYNFIRLSGGVTGASTNIGLVVRGDGRAALGRDVESPYTFIVSPALNDGQGNFLVEGYGAEPMYPNIYGRRANGTRDNPVAVSNNDSLLSIFGRGYGSTGWVGSAAGSKYGAAENWNSNSNGAYVTWESTKRGQGIAQRSEWMRLLEGNLGIGTTNPLYRVHLSDGEIYAPTGSFTVINGQTSNAWETARQNANSALQPAATNNVATQLVAGVGITLGKTGQVVVVSGGSGSGDFLANGTVPMTGFGNAGGFGWTNNALIISTTGEFTTVKGIGAGSLVATNVADVYGLPGSDLRIGLGRNFNAELRFIDGSKQGVGLVNGTNKFMWSGSGFLLYDDLDINSNVIKGGTVSNVTLKAATYDGTTFLTNNGATAAAATNAQFYGTNFPLTLAASDIVAFTNRANATNVYLLGLLSRPCDLNTYNGGAGSITATCDLVYFLPTNDLTTATPVTSFTNITVSQAGASGSLNVVGVTNRLYALMLTNAVGSGSWHVNIDGVQH